MESVSIWLYYLFSLVLVIGFYGRRVLKSSEEKGFSVHFKSTLTHYANRHEITEMPLSGILPPSFVRLKIAFYYANYLPT